MRTSFGNSGLYGSRFWARCIWHNTYTGPKRGKQVNVTPIQGSVLRNDTKFNYTIGSLNVIPKLLSEKINNVTIKDYFDPRIVDPAVFNFVQKGNVNHFLFAIILWLNINQDKCILKHCSCRVYVHIPLETVEIQWRLWNNSYSQQKHGTLAY